MGFLRKGSFLALWASGASCAAAKMAGSETIRLPVGRFPPAADVWRSVGATKECAGRVCFRGTGGGRRAKLVLMGGGGGFDRVR